MGEKCLGDGQAEDPCQQTEGSIDEPEDAEHPDLAGVVFQFELQARDRGNHGRGRTTALGAEGLPWR
jgi:hypothetical protein